jgi:hypothetical protein
MVKKTIKKQNNNDTTPSSRPGTMGNSGDDLKHKNPNKTLPFFFFKKKKKKKKKPHKIVRYTISLHPSPATLAALMYSTSDMCSSLVPGGVSMTR